MESAWGGGGFAVRKSALTDPLRGTMDKANGRRSWAQERDKLLTLCACSSFRYLHAFCCVGGRLGQSPLITLQ